MQKQKFCGLGQCVQLPDYREGDGEQRKREREKERKVDINLVAGS